MTEDDLLLSKLYRPTLIKNAITIPIIYFACCYLINYCESNCRSDPFRCWKSTGFISSYFSSTANCRRANFGYNNENVTKERIYRMYQIPLRRVHSGNHGYSKFSEYYNTIEILDILIAMTLFQKSF